MRSRGASFDDFDVRIDKNANASGKYAPEDKELEYLNEPFVTRKN